MKIAEQIFEDGQNLVIKETHDVNATLREAAELRSRGIVGFSENRLVARVDKAIVAQWLQEAGVRWDDPAFQDVIFRKLNDPDYAHVRVWGGRA